jgi:urea transport system substrate-binding protein
MRLTSRRLFFVIMLLIGPTIAYPEDPIRIGVLHSLSGTMAISETALKDSLLMFVDEQNKRGGLLGRPLQAVVLDPASNWPFYAEKARQLIERENVAVIFGCWTSASRKAVIPVMEELNRLLFYPVQYEGQEFSANVFYLGAAPNQQALPAVRYLKEEMGIERWILVGTDYVYPRTTNRILTAYLQGQGVAPQDIMLSYTPFGHADWQRIVSDIKNFALAGKKTAVISTVNGDANIAFYRELAAQNVQAGDIPVLAFSIGEQELSALNVEPLVGHLAAWNYFMSVDSAENTAFISKWHKHTGDLSRVTNDPMEAQYIGFRMWVAAVESAGSLDTDKVRQALIGIRVPNLSGGSAEMQANHHISKPAYIGRMRRDGQFELLWRSTQDIPGNAWSEYLPAVADKGYE